MSSPGIELFKQALVDPLDQEYEVDLPGGRTLTGRLDIRNDIATIDGWTFRLSTVTAWRKKP